MNTATIDTSARPASTSADRRAWLARLLAALDRALASSADGARGF